jgi:acyl-CoA synthetase (AMP-forming)/AMP-acid ligase II
MAETTLIVSGGDPSAPPILEIVQKAALEQNRVVLANSAKDALTQTIVGCGQPLQDLRVVIVHPETMTCCKPNEVGEIWVSGPSVAQGYWNRPEQTEQTFRAQVQDTGKGPFLRTGDLGFLHDGELFVTGRVKDMIIIRGQNHYPQDIELTVEKSHPALRSGCGAVFTVEVKGQERLVVVQEVERNYLRKLDVNEVVGSINQAVATEHGLQVYATVLVKTGSIPKTSSGKIQRNTCRSEFLSGSLNVLQDWSENPESKTKFLHLHTEVESLLQQLQASKQ